MWLARARSVQPASACGTSTTNEFDRIYALTYEWLTSACVSERKAGGLQGRPWQRRERPPNALRWLGPAVGVRQGTGQRPGGHGEQEGAISAFERGWSAGGPFRESTYYMVFMMVP